MSATPGAAIDRAGQHEQEVAQPVQVNDDRLRDVLPRCPGERDGQPLGAPADGAGQVDLRGGRRAAGQDELRERLELVLEPVDRRFQPRDVARP